MRRRPLELLLFLLPVGWLLLHLGQVAFPPGSAYTDLLVSHLPNAVWIQQSLARGEGVPLWSRNILSGYPFAANPLSGLHYPPGWLALLLPLPVGLNLLMALHLLWGGVGMARFLVDEGLDRRAALLGGLALAALPKLHAHLAAGHVSLVYAVAWTPWLLLAERRFAGRRLGLLLPGALLGLIALADPRWAVYAGAAWLAFSARNALRQGSGVLVWLRSRLSNLVFAGLVAAPLLLPLMEYTAFSTRSLLTPQDSLALSLPPGRLLGLLYPTYGGSAEWTLYPGAAAAALVAYAVARRGAWRRLRFWLAGLGLALLVSLGSYFPLAGLLARLPGVSLLRVPPRAMFLGGLFGAAALAVAVDALLAARPSAPETRTAKLGWFAASALIVLFGLGGAALLPDALLRLGFGLGALLWLAGALLAGRLAGRNGLFAGLLALCLLDWGLANGLAAEFRPVEQAFAPGQAAAELLRRQPNPGRVYSPSYSLPQHVAAVQGIPLADGVDPLQLSAYVSFMEAATSVPQVGYSVTLPPFPSGDPLRDTAAFTPDPARLAWLNVTHVVAAFPLGGGWRLVEQVDGLYVYANPVIHPHAWVQSGTALGPGPVTPALVTAEYANGIEVQAQGPGVLALAEIDYPGWRVWVDGQPAEAIPVGGLLRGVALPEGSHTVRWRFVPLRFYAGWGCFALALVGLLVAWRRDDR